MSDVRPTIAFLSPIEPAMTGNGLAMRMGQFADALAAFADVHVIVISAAGRLAGVARVKTPNITIHEIETSRRTDTQFNLLSRIADDDARLAAFRAYGKPSLARFVSASVLGDLAILLETTSSGRCYNWSKLSVAVHGGAAGRASNCRPRRR